MKKIIGLVFCTLILITSLYYGKEAIGLKQSSAKLTPSEISLFHESIGVFENAKSNIKVSLPTKGMPMNGDPVVFETYPVVTIGDKTTELKQYKIFYNPTSSRMIIRQPIFYTAKGEVLFTNNVYPNELYQITNDGNIIKIDTPFVEISSLNVNPIDNKAVITGNLPEGKPEKKFFELDLDKLLFKEFFSYINSDKSVTAGVTTNMDYSIDGTLYFDILNGKVPCIYSYNGIDVIKIRDKASQPKVSADGKYLAFCNIDNVYVKEQKEQMNLEVINILSKKSIGKQPGVGTIVWDNQNNNVYLEEQTNLKVFKIGINNLELLENIETEGHPFVIDNKGQKEFYIEGFETDNPNVVWKKIIK